MKIEQVELTEQHVGKRVIYVPRHAKDRNDSICEGGAIKSWNVYGIFVVYDRGITALTPEELLIWE